MDLGLGLKADPIAVDYTFEDNNLHDLAHGVADSAGFYSGRTWSDRGNVVRRNNFSRSDLSLGARAPSNCFLPRTILYKVSLYKIFPSFRAKIPR